MFQKCQEIAQDAEKVTSLTAGEIRALLDEVGRRFEEEPKLVELGSGRAVFVGDTHGDFEATREVIARYLSPENTVVFLGDYVDRGQRSNENINYLLSLKLVYPENLLLLMGNHEAHGVMQFYPADFWERLTPDLYGPYASALLKLPLAVFARGGIVALHGALPDLRSLEDINDTVVGSEAWRQVIWGDWQETSGGSLGDDLFSGRPQFGEDYFREVMDRFAKNVLVRSHQPTAPPAMYDRRCLTIFTSSAYRLYAPRRTVAIVDLGGETKTVDDLAVETV